MHAAQLTQLKVGLKLDVCVVTGGVLGLACDAPPHASLQREPTAAFGLFDPPDGLLHGPVKLLMETVCFKKYLAGDWMKQRSFKLSLSGASHENSAKDLFPLRKSSSSVQKYSPVLIQLRLLQQQKYLQELHLSIV